MGLKTPAKNANLSEELIHLVRDMMRQQADVLKVAMDTQKAQADVLNKWIGMFTPQGTPAKSTSVDEREQLRMEMEAAEWDPLTAPLFPSSDESLF